MRPDSITNPFRKAERRLISGVVMVILLSGFSGCAWLRSGFVGRGQSPPQIFGQVPTKDQIIAAVNANSQAVRSMQAKVQVRAPGTPALSGEISVEQPSRLRMQAGLLNLQNSGIDIGSNDQEFWVWLKTPLPGQPPAVLYAGHEEFERSPAKQQLPIEPSWVIDSLGLAYFDPRVQHEGPFSRADGSLEMVSRYDTGSGPMVKKTIVDSQTSVVVAQEIYRGNVMVAASRASRHQYFPEINASLPRTIQIHVGLNTQEPGKVTIDLSNVRPNSITPEYAGLWVMPNPKNISKINIARQGSAGASSGRPATGQHSYSQQPSGATVTQVSGHSMIRNHYPSNQVDPRGNSVQRIDPYQPSNQRAQPSFYDRNDQYRPNLRGYGNQD